MKAHSIYLWSNGMVMTFDKAGQQIGELQGPATEALGKALDALVPGGTCYMGQWDGGCTLVEQESLRVFARMLSRKDEDAG